ncbi:hypothetical protein [Corynebacterium pygosceleis]|uniref:hypothetical protein n=1 Tax=Corynebacterium pygosceleis TaxID=2800406 RepID=UPI001906AD89|nr:hypothetical protein [Corynebacterium pygosceleis]MCL0121603.1 hypothetical protein [Corynebacterium pygosceleis]
MDVDSAFDIVVFPAPGSPATKMRDSCVIELSQSAGCSNGGTFLVFEFDCRINLLASSLDAMMACGIDMDLLQIRAGPVT